MGTRQAIGDAVAAVDPSAAVLEVEELHGGVSAEVWRVDLARPDGSRQRVVVRWHESTALKQHDGDVVAREHAVLSALHARGLAVPRPLRLVTPPRTTGNVLVMEWIDGSTHVEPTWRGSALAQIAAFLATLHDVAPAELEIDGLAEIEDPRTELPALLPEDELGDRIRSALRAVPASLPANPPSLLHGDYWPGNVLWDGGHLVAVIDWEDCAIGDPLADLACARIELACQYDHDAMHAFTEDYLRAMADRPRALDLGALPLWETYASAAALSSMSDWGLTPEDERRRRRRTTELLALAGRALAGGR